MRKYLSSFFLIAILFSWSFFLNNISWILEFRFQLESKDSTVENFIRLEIKCLIDWILFWPTVPLSGRLVFSYRAVKINMVIQTCDTFRFHIWLYDFPCDITQFYVTWLIFNRFNGWKFSHFASIRYFRFEFDAYSMNYARNNKYSIYTFKSKSSLELDKLRLLFFFFLTFLRAMEQKKIDTSG